ncbi:MAG: hypothetical protein WDO16_16655 [Bacteroidota bacterium]
MSASRNSHSDTMIAQDTSDTEDLLDTDEDKIMHRYDSRIDSRQARSRIHY